MWKHSIYISTSSLNNSSFFVCKRRNIDVDVAVDVVVIGYANDALFHSAAKSLCVHNVKWTRPKIHVEIEREKMKENLKQKRIQ